MLRPVILLLLILGLAAPALAQEPADDPETQADASDAPEANFSQEDPAEPDTSLDEGPSKVTDPEDPEEGDFANDDSFEIDDDEDSFETRVAPQSREPTVAYDAPNASLRLDRTGLAGLRVNLDALLEYVDANANGAYDLGEEVLQRHALRDLPAHIEGAHPDATTRDVVYMLPSNATLRLKFQLGAAQDASVKYDVVLDGFAFRSPDTRIALGTLSISSLDLRVATVGGDPAIVGTADEGEVPYMSWVQIVQVDGRDEVVGWSVHTSMSEDHSSAIVYWSYPQGDHIVHDPEIGVTQALRVILGQPLAYALGMIATLSLLGGTYLVRRGTR